MGSQMAPHWAQSQFWTGSRIGTWDMETNKEHGQGHRTGTRKRSKSRADA